MERKIGEIFEYNGEYYQCLKSPDGSCKHCDMNFGGKCPIPIKECVASARSDLFYVIFKKLEKVGEPYEHDEKFYQCYKLSMETEIRLLPNNCYPIGKDNLVEIEVKQNKKEDMEENKLNLKPFDIQKASPSAHATDGLQAWCKKCQKERVRTNYTNNHCNPDLAQFTPRQLIEELKNRGYTGEIQYVQKIKL